LGNELSPRVEADTDLDGELKTILLTAVSRDVDRRYPSIEDMSAVMGGYLESIWPGRSRAEDS
jgi:hypothetical protein